MHTDAQTDMHIDTHDTAAVNIAAHVPAMGIAASCDTSVVTHSADISRRCVILCIVMVHAEGACCWCIRQVLAFSCDWTSIVMFMNVLCRCEFMCSPTL